MALIRPARERPLLPIRDGGVIGLDLGSELAPAVEAARPVIRRTVAATGRIELSGHPSMDWVGTGFLAGPGLVVTTGHIADEFTQSAGRRILRYSPVFRMGMRKGEGPEYSIVACLNRHPVLDFAVLELEQVPEAEPLILDAGANVEVGEPVGVVASMAQDRRNDPEWIRDLGEFEDGQTMFCPGRILGHSTDRYYERGSWSLTHDCSTLGGAGGAALIHLESGRVLGCHFGGLFQRENYAVLVSELALDPRIRSLGLSFADRVPDPDPWAFEAEYADPWPSTLGQPAEQSSQVSGATAARLPEVGLNRVDQHLTARFPDLDDALDYLRGHGPAYAQAIDAQPGRGRVSNDEYRRAVLVSLNQRGLLDADFVSSLVPPDETFDWREATADAAGSRAALSSDTLDALTAVLPGSAQPYVIGSPFTSQLVRPDGTIDPLPDTVRRLAGSSAEKASEALAWLLRAVAERGGTKDITPISAALRELGQPQVSEVLSSRTEPDPLEMVAISFLSSGLTAARSVGIVRLGSAGSTGWLIAPDLVVAPAHLTAFANRGPNFEKLLPKECVDIGEAHVEFDGDGPSLSKVQVKVAEIASLDYSTDLMVLRLAEQLSDRQPLQMDLNRLSTGPVATIHHPGLGAKALSYVGGELIGNDGHEVKYLLATTRGSAGAPIFSQSWKVIATHRAAMPALDESGVGLGAKLGTSVEALVERFRSAAGERLWRRICGAQEALRSVDPVLLSLESGERNPALVVVVDEATTLPEIPGLSLISRDREYVSVLLDDSAARQLAVTQGVVSLSASGTATQMECRASLPFIGIPLDRDGIEETGDCAIVAIIDEGIDPYHRAFLDADGNSRIDLYWDQRDTTVPSDAPARTVLDEAAVLVTRHRIKGGAVYLGSDLDRFDEGERAALRDGVEHGTAVASIAAGRPAGPHERHFGGGLAPDARLIVVRFDAGGQSIGTSVGHLNALGLIGSRAEELGLPVVVNISNGMNSGAHDGSSRVEKACAHFVEQPNRAIVKSAGNELGAGRHAQFKIVDANTKVLRWISTPSITPSREGDADELEVWFGTHNIYDFVLEDPNRNRTGVFPMRQPMTEKLSTLNDLHVTYEHIATTNPRKSRLSIRISPGRKKAVQAGEWKLIVKAREFRGLDTVHAWLEEQLDRQLSFKADVERHCTITIPGTGPDVITVGAIEARPQPLVYEKGSLGPNADGIVKPDLVAPGIDIAAARAGTDADAMSEARSGTSFAAPHVAGAIALAFSMAHKATQTGAPAIVLSQGEVRQLLINASEDFNVHGSAERGYGRLNARAFLAAVRERIAWTQRTAPGDQ